MSYALEVKGISKKYPSFELRDVSFALEEGKIVGFIGRNGAGKTTTLKSLVNLVHPDSGEAFFFGRSFKDHELEIKQDIGFVLGGIDYYPMKRLGTITNVTKAFYENWDEAVYQKYMKLFRLVDSKTPKELSDGMKVKYSLVLALSHHARLLILDEPTSGLDPVSRDELLDVFLKLVDEEAVTILFSTHITSDLERCADDIVYIKDGSIIEAGDMDEYISRHCLVQIESKQLPENLDDVLIGIKKNRNGWSALAFRTSSLPECCKTSDATLQDIMVHLEKEEL
ncbi:MAG: ABC transporter ATP-binding protein [Sphaerochaetaceae bacterium]|jgi:ABC-2 type transport system ATP-binding protein|nr:ABC transporter ATP-binding protein [Sphaerochaetaceae bacterium]